MSRRTPRLDAARLDEALRLARLGRFDVARRRAMAWLGRAPNPHPQRRSAAAQALGEIAGLALAQQAAGEAERCLRAALRLAPRFADLHHRLAALLSGQERLEEARAELLVALEINPDYVAARVELALLDARLGRLGDALEALRRLEQSRRPEQAESLQQGLRSMRQADWEDAGRLLRRAWKVSEGSLDAELGRFMRWVREGDLGRARALARDLLKAHPDFPDLHYLLGCVELELGFAGDALGSFVQALELNPDFHAARVELACALDAVGELGMAQEQIQLVLRMDPRHPGALRVQGRWRHRRGSEDPQLTLDPDASDGQSS
jgi:tetratricopeptide (TPR) repeat protein